MKTQTGHACYKNATTQRYPALAPCEDLGERLLAPDPGAPTPAPAARSDARPAPPAPTPAVGVEALGRDRVLRGGEGVYAPPDGAGGAPRA